jgi:ribonuclease III
MIQNIKKAEKFLKIKFKDKKLLQSALTHKSSNQKLNNEKLEFLGDRVLGLILSKKLYDLYPNDSEGILDKKFAILVKKKTCSDIAWSLGMQNYIITGNQNKKINNTDQKILSDACEAIIGAIFIDRGFEYVKNFIIKNWKKNLEESIITVLDAKTRLQEYSLKRFKKLPTYKTISSTGPKHNPEYKISVSITGTKDFIGIGNSKQKAEQNSAEKLLKDQKI